jgi:hypothetical protein
MLPPPPPGPPGGGGGAGARERGARKFFILFIIIKLEAAGVIKDYFRGILSSNDIYIYIYKNREKKTKSDACATHLAATHFKINAVFKI